MAAVSVVLPWSMWPIVPMFTCGLVRSNFFLRHFRLLLGCRPVGSSVAGAGFEPATQRL